MRVVVWTMETTAMIAVLKAMSIGTILAAAAVDGTVGYA